MGKETKIGLGVIAALLVVFAVVLTLRLRGSSDETVAAADTAESAAGAKEKDAEKVKAAPNPKFAAPKPLAPPKTKSSLKLTIPTAPVPAPDTKTNGPSQWKMVGSGPRQSQPPAPIPSSTSSRYASGGLVLDPPSAQRQSQPGSNRYAQRQPASTSQTSRYQSPYGKSNYQNISTGGTTAYGRGNNQQYYGRQGSYVSRQGLATQQTYVDQRAAAQPQISPSQIAPSSITPSAATLREPAAGLRADGKYEVQPNDNYWRISKRLYGSGAYFKALAEHNRREHPQADKLRVGDQIYTPSLDKLVDSFPDLCPSPRRQKTLAKRSNVISVSNQYGGSTYTVAEGDTLYDIAHYELGDASRWVEIHKLNLNALQGDFDYLVPGMKLTMPRGKSAVQTRITNQTQSPRQYTVPRGATDTLTRRPTRYQSPSTNTLRR